MTQTLPISEARGLPAPLTDALRRLIRRSRSVIVLRGACAVLAAMLLSLLVVMALDRAITTYAAWPRWLMTVGFWSATAAAIGWFLVRPLAKSFTLAGMARLIETRHPELQERLSSAVELLTSDEDATFRGSEVLIAALARQATDDVRTMTPKREISLGPAKPFLLAAAAAVGILAIVAVLWPQRTWRGLARGLAPWANISKFADGTIVVKPGDTPLAQDEPLRVTATFADADVRQARLRLETPDGQESVYPMSLTGRDEKDRPTFAYACPASVRDYRYRVHAAGADPTRYYNVRILPVPKLAALRLEIHLPDYAAEAPLILDPAGGDIRALAGSRLVLKARASCPLSQARIVLDQAERTIQPVEMIGDEETTAAVFEMDVPAGTSDTWRLHMRSSQGVEAVAGPYDLESATDLPPSAAILAPARRELRLAPDGDLPLLLRGRDAIGIASARLLLEADGKERKPIPIPVSAGEEAAAKPPLLLKRPHELDLGALPLQRSDVLTVRFEVADTLPAQAGGPQKALSRPLTIRLDRQAPPIAEQIALAEELAFRDALEAILKQLNEARKDTRRLKKDLGRIHSAVKRGRVEAAEAKLPGGATTRIDRSRQHLGQATRIAAQAVDEARMGTFAPLADSLERISREHIAAAASDAGQIKLAPSAKDWSELADRADYRVYQAIEDIEALLAKLSTASELATKARKLEDLAGRQEDLAEAAARRGAQPPADGEQDDAEMDQWRKQQEQVSGELGEMVNADPLARQMAAEQNTAEARDLAGEARQLAQQQKAAAKDTAEADELGRLQDKLQQEQEQSDDGDSHGDDSQGKPSRRARQLDEQMARQRSSKTDEQLKRLAKQQKRIAREVAKLAGKVDKSEQAPDEAHTDAAVAANEVANKLQAGQGRDAAEQAAKAEKKLDQLARRMGNKEGDEASEDKPDHRGTEADDEQVQVGAEQVMDEGQNVRTPEQDRDRKALGDEARKLAREQKRLREQIEDVLAGKDKQLARKRQEQLRTRTKALGRTVEKVQAEIEDLKLDRSATDKVKRARGELDEATEVQDEAAGSIEDDELAKASRQQDAAARKLDRAGDLLEQAGAEMKKIADQAARQADQAESAEGEGQEMSAGLAEALDSAAESATSGEAQAAGETATKLSQLARAAAQAAQQAGAQAQASSQGQPQPGQASEAQAQGAEAATAESQTGAGPGDARELVALRLEQLGLSPDDWARLPGKLRDEVSQAAGARVPAEYRQIVKWYFQAQARRRAPNGAPADEPRNRRR